MKSRATLFSLAILFAATIVTESIVAADKPHIVMLIAEREYDTDVSLTAFAKEHLDGTYRVTILRADPADRESLVGTEAIEKADVLLVSVRRRTLPPEQLSRIQMHVAGGKPVIGIRTANHAFCLRKGDPPKGRAVWPQWDRDVFGGNYTGHHGNNLKTTYQTVAKNQSHVILEGIRSSEKTVTGGSLYKVAPLATGATILLSGSVPDQPAEPIAWTFKRADGGKSFYTSLGHVDDFSGPVMPLLLNNAIAWSLR